MIDGIIKHSCVMMVDIIIKNEFVYDDRHHHKNKNHCMTIDRITRYHHKERFCDDRHHTKQLFYDDRYHHDTSHILVMVDIIITHKQISCVMINISIDKRTICMMMMMIDIIMKTIRL